MADVSVGFAVASGGGSVAGAPAVTSSSGVATVGSWTLGTTSGTNTLTASVSSLTPVTFTATGAAGPAAVVVKTAGDNQTAEDGTPVAVPPSVTVQDANGNSVRQVGVSFGFIAGGTGNVGTVTGSFQSTNDAGVATVGSWTLGLIGPNRLDARVGTLPVVTFAATAAPRAACSVIVNQLDPDLFRNGELTSTDCRLPDGPFIDRFSFRANASQWYSFTQRGTFDTFMFLFDAGGNLIGRNDNFESLPSRDSRIKALLPGGTFIVGASSPSMGATGSYDLVATLASGPNACDEVYAARGTQTSQILQLTDCSRNGFRSDDMLIFLREAQTVTMSMTTTAFDAILQLRDFLDTVVAFDNAPGTNNSQIVFTPPTSAFYKIVPTSALQDATGAYTLTIGP